MARLAAYYLAHDSEHTIAATVLPESAVTADLAETDIPLVSIGRLRVDYPPEQFGMFVAVEPERLNQERERRFNEAHEWGYALVSYISSRATIWPDARIGANCMILERSVIQPFAEIGDDVVLSPGCHIGHESIVGDHCFLDAMTVVSGNVVIGPRTFIGANAAIRNSVRLGRDVHVRAGSMVAKPVPDEHSWVTAGTAPAGASGARR